MKLHGVSSYLQHFELDSPQESAKEQPHAPPAATRKPEPECDETRQSLAAQIYETAEREFATRLKNAQDDFSRRLVAERGRWREEEGRLMAIQVKALFDANFDELNVSIENILRPFVMRRALDQLLQDFLATLRAAMANQDKPLLKISAPAEFLDSIDATLQEENIAAELFVCSRPEISATIGSTRILTQMKQWLAELQEKDLTA